ncbi:MAG: JAB domain-containing protein [Bacillota bacterium]|jgi:DNA repair protein RadC
MDNKLGKKVIHHHAGHRERMKRRYMEYGIDGMEDHEVLELLLFFALPYRDTNGLAHELLYKFGSLSNVLGADISALESINGIGPNAALLLNLIPQLAGRYYLDCRSELPTLHDTDDILEYVKTLFIGRKTETFFMICMDGSGKVKNTVKLAEGTAGEVFVYTSQVVEVALQQKCKLVVFAHNHPNGTLKASHADVDTTRMCLEALSVIDVNLVDHIIVCGDSMISMANKNLIYVKNQTIK